MIETNIFMTTLPSLTMAAIVGSARTPTDHLHYYQEPNNSVLINLEVSFRELSIRGVDKRQQLSNATRDDLINGKCNDIVVIYARGTLEVGNIGDILGPAVITALEGAEPGRVIAQGVWPYNADLIGYLAGGSDQGAESMRNLTERAASQCPKAQMVWAGYR